MFKCLNGKQLLSIVCVYEDIGVNEHHSVKVAWKTPLFYFEPFEEVKNLKDEYQAIPIIKIFIFL